MICHRYGLCDDAAWQVTPSRIAQRMAFAERTAAQLTYDIAVITGISQSKYHDIENGYVPGRTNAKISPRATVRTVFARPHREFSR